jgi:hypothetical protein
MAKDRNGQVKPHNLGGSRFKDGSLRQVTLVFSSAQLINQ